MLLQEEDNKIDVTIKQQSKTLKYFFFCVPVTASSMLFAAYLVNVLKFSLMLDWKQVRVAIFFFQSLSEANKQGTQYLFSRLHCRRDYEIPSLSDRLGLLPGVQRTGSL